jgi:predicted ester cyclase
MRNLPIALAAALCSAVPAPGAAAGPARPPTVACAPDSPNLKTYLQMHKVLFMDRDGTRVEEFYAPEVISHNLDSGGSGARRVKSAALAAMWTASRRNDPDRVLADELILCAGDYVVVRTTMHGKDTTGVDGWPATGKPYAVTATDIYRFENGRVVERWGNADLISLFRQVGYTLVPAGKAPPAPGKPAP